jgi:hypothetical protein
MNWPLYNIFLFTPSAPHLFPHLSIGTFSARSRIAEGILGPVEKLMPVVGFVRVMKSSINTSLKKNEEQGGFV